MELSDRLQAVADMVTPGSIVCDVGCDHGYVPIYLTERGISPKVIAMDIGAGPLERAREHIRAHRLEEYIETRRSDGLAALHGGEADCLILAGMGGRLAVRILTEGREKTAGMREVILQLQSDLTGVRRFLREEGMRILREDMVREDGKYYTVIKALSSGEVAGREKDTAYTGTEGIDPEPGSLRQQACDRYGGYLLENGHPVLYDFLIRERERDRAISRRISSGSGETQAAGKRLEELTQSSRIRDCAISYYREE